MKKSNRKHYPYIKPTNWRRAKISIDIMSEFITIFGYSFELVSINQGNPHIAVVDEIIPKNNNWDETLLRYYEILDKYAQEGRHADYTETALWKHEVDNLHPKTDMEIVKKRIMHLFNLYDSIKKRGFVRRPGDLIRLLYVKDLKPVVVLERGGRTSDTYYRINGMRRVILCKYFNIEKINCRLFKVAIS